MAYSEGDLDALTRMVIGEAGNQPPEGQAAVAHVALNRVNRGNFPGGSSLSGVIAAPWQFEGYNARAKGLPAASPEYQSARKIAEGVVSGDIPDPTGGKVNFYSPKLQADLGRKTPDWAQGQGQRIGGHVFYGGTPPAGGVNRSMAFAGGDGMGAGSNDDDLFGRLINSKPTAAKGAAGPPEAEDDLFGRLINAKATQARAPAVKGALGVAAGVAGMTDQTDTMSARSADPSKDQGTVPAALYGALRGVPIVGPWLDDRSTDLAAIARTKLFGASQQEYEQAKAQISGRETATLAAHPTAEKVGGVGGAILGTAPLMAVAPEAFGLQKAPMLARMAPSALTGAAIAGADSLVRGGPEGETADQARERILWAGGIGAGAGLLSVPAGDAIGSILTGAGRLAGRVFGSGAGDAARTLTNRVGEAGATPDAIQADLATNPHLRPVDVNEGLLVTGQRLAAKGGPEARAVIDESVANTKDAAAGAVNDAYDASLGASQNGLAYINGLKATTKANANAAFGPILKAAKPVDVTGVIQTIDSAIKPGLTGVASQGATDLPLGADKTALLAVKNLLTNGKQNVVNAERLHQIQYQLREWADGLAKSANGSERNTAGALYKIRQVLNDAIDKATPLVDPADPSKGGLFRAAQAQFKGDKEIEDAFQIGLGFWQNKGGMGAMETRPEAWAQWWKAASPEEQDAVKAGIRDAVQNEKGRVNNEALKGEGMVKPAYNKEKLAIVFGQKEADALIKELGDQANIAFSNAKLVSGSKTAETSAADSAVKDVTAGDKAASGFLTIPNIVAGSALGALGHAVGGPLLGVPAAAAGLAGRAVINKTAGAVMNRIAANHNRELAKALVDPDAFGRLIGKAAKSTNNARRLSAAGNLAIRDRQTRSAIGQSGSAAAGIVGRLLGGPAP